MAVGMNLADSGDSQITRSPDLQITRFFLRLLQSATRLVSAQVAVADFLIAAATDEAEFHQVLGCVSPAVMFQANQFTPVAPGIGIRVARIVEVAKKAKILPEKQMLADNRFWVLTVLAAANGFHTKNLPGVSGAFRRCKRGHLC
jgi:hypothetical protein